MRYVGMLLLAVGLPLVGFQPLVRAESNPSPAQALQPVPEAQPVPVRQVRPAVPKRSTGPKRTERHAASKMNAWTLGVGAGPLNSTALRIVSDLAFALNEDQKLRLVPIMSAGGVQNINDLLYLKGVDVAVTSSDVLFELKVNGKIQHIDQRIKYIAPLYISELTIIARPEIQSLNDLHGKKVGFQMQGASTSVSGRILFERLGIEVRPVNLPSEFAYHKMKTGEIAALLHDGGMPNPFLLNLKLEPGFHLLDVPYAKFDDYYVPSTLTRQDYPNLIAPGKQVETLGSVVVLVAYNWPKGSPRGGRVRRFIERLIRYCEKLAKPPFHPKWRGLNLQAKLPGWSRHWVAESALAAAAARHQNKLSTRLKVDAGRSGPMVGEPDADDARNPYQPFQGLIQWLRRERLRPLPSN